METIERVERKPNGGAGVRRRLFGIETADGKTKRALFLRFPKHCKRGARQQGDRAGSEPAFDVLRMQFGGVL